MGFINKILPNKFKPLSRDIGFLSNAIIYKIKCIRRKTHSYPILILGNQKSGTSVISGLLGEISSKKTAIDLFYSGFKYSLFLKWKDKKISTKEIIYALKSNIRDLPGGSVKALEGDILLRGLGSSSIKAIENITLRNNDIG